MIFLLFFLFIVLSIVTGILMVSTRIAAKFTPSFGTAFKAVIVVNLLNFGINRGLKELYGADADGMTMLVIGAIVNFILQAIILSTALTNPEYNEKVTFWQACLISILQTTFLVIFAIVLLTVFFGGLIALR
jgi:hypothetical protein